MELFDRMCARKTSNLSIWLYSHEKTVDYFLRDKIKISDSKLSKYVVGSTLSRFGL